MGALREGRTDADLAARVAPLAPLIRRAQPNVWVAAAVLRDGEFVREAIERGVATRSVPAASVEATTGVPLDAYLPEARRLGAGSETPAQDVTATATFDPLRGTLAVRSSLRVGGRFVTGSRTFADAGGQGIFVGRDGVETRIDLEPGSAEATFAAMGPEAAAFLRGLAPAPDLPERPVLPNPPWTLSSGLERLAAGGQDLAMALSPRFEWTPAYPPGGATPPALSFGSVLARRAGAGDVILGYEDLAGEAGLDAAAFEARRARIARRRCPWRTVDRDGTWLVVNPYGFLDRADPISPVPFLAMERALRAQGDGGIPDAPTIATARRMTRAMPLPSRGFMAALGYRDLDLRDDLALLAMLGRVAGAPPTDQTAFWHELGGRRAATIDTPDGPITLRLNGDERAPNVVGGYLFPGTATATGGADLGYVRFDGRGTVLP